MLFDRCYINVLVINIDLIILFIILKKTKQIIGRDSHGYFKGPVKFILEQL